MHLAHLEIANFRRLLSVRIDCANEKTLFVGANNSGKTSAMRALRRFLANEQFDVHDITMSQWASIDELGQEWLEGHEASPTAERLVACLPSLDLWFEVAANEVHLVGPLIPTLDWDGGLLGVRLRLQPKDHASLCNNFVRAKKEIEDVWRTISQPEGVRDTKGGGANAAKPLTVWPKSLTDFLRKRLPDQFSVKLFTLDPEKLKDPDGHMARPQGLPADAIDLDPTLLTRLVRVDEISAQRGLGELHSESTDRGTSRAYSSHRLSHQLRRYYKKHLDPADSPDPSDIDALKAIEAAQRAFDQRLMEGFSGAFNEVQGLGYPGVTDPRPRVSTRLNPIDGLDHQAAISFELDLDPGDGTEPSRLDLPEAFTGLGYQNLILMIFRLIEFRDAWMKVGRASAEIAEMPIEPLHLVLVEEPEAHLHAQVQQVFINKAYHVLRAHEDLGDSKTLHSQLIVSTHSSHVAHEIPFGSMRYFRRLPAGAIATSPASSIINLSEVFGEDETESFVTRYLRVQHADLFFADAAILVEGAAERILLPNLIRDHHPLLTERYITVLEIGGSHAHRLRPLIEHLGLPTLIVTDLDAQNADGKAGPTKRDSGQVSNNETLKTWVPKLDRVDDLLDANADAKTKVSEELFRVRVAYQTLIEATHPRSLVPQNAWPYTFEDALVFENLPLFAMLEGPGLAKKVQNAINENEDVTKLASKLFTVLRDGGKAEFALTVLESSAFNQLKAPKYIVEGLEWLENQLRPRRVEASDDVEAATTAKVVVE